MFAKNLLLFLYFGPHLQGTLFQIEFDPEMGYCQDSIPTPLEFVSTLLNVTEQALEKLPHQDSFFLETTEKNINFVLYLPSNQSQNITSENAQNFLKPENPTKMLIHGWATSASHHWIPKMASLYHQKGNYNVIAPDWSRDAAKNYLYAASVSQSVGGIIGNFILNITKKSPNFPTKVHILGHSLGGQIAGFVGKKVLESGLKIDRITGLDAASPLFETPFPTPPSFRITSTDASFVDLIHTNKGMYGVAKPYGHVDFYVNDGGPIQPGCENSDFLEASSCSHQKAHMVYSETVLDEQKFEAVSYSSLRARNGNPKVFLGEGVSKEASGSFYVRT